jgi:4-amino-4-deoxy-L-arabinose transferase-like glycosyltransferase
LTAFALVKVPTLTLPIFLDETYVVGTADRIASASFFPLPAGAPAWGHTPLIFEMAAVVRAIAGPQSWALHLVSLALSLWTLAFTWLLADRLGGRPSGAAAAAMLAACPLFMAQAGLLQLDLGATAFTVSAVYFLACERWTAYVVSAALMLLSKETSVILIPMMTLMVWLRDASREHRQRLGQVALTFAPLAALLLWSLFNKYTTGFWRGDALSHASDWDVIASNYSMGYAKRFVIRWAQLLLLNRQFVVAAIVTAGLFSTLRRHHSNGGVNVLRGIFRRWPVENALACAIAVSVVFHVVFGVLHPRYMLPVVPFLFVLTALALHEVAGRRMPIVAAAVVVLLASGWFSAPGKYSAAEASLDYVDIVKAHEMAARFLEGRTNRDTILAPAFQGGANLTSPEIGYVSRPLSIVIPERANPGGVPTFDLAYYCPTDQFSADVLAIVRARGLSEFKRFESGRYFIALYASK